jgi:hypothetical protein
MSRQKLRETLNRVLLWDGLAFVVSMMLCVVFLIAGWLFIPRHTSVVDRNFNVQIQSDPALLRELSLTMAPTTAGHYNLTISASTQSNDVSAVNLKFFFQSGVLASCPVVDCSPATTADQNILTISMMSDARVTVPFTASVFTFGANGEEAAGWLPYINCPGCSADLLPVIRVTYVIARATTYNWSSGPPPGLTSGKAVWTQFPDQLQEPVLVSGTDPDAQQRDNEQIFAAGACAGIAGAMLATSMQDGLTWAGIRRRRRVGVQ